MERTVLTAINFFGLNLHFLLVSALLLIGATLFAVKTAKVARALRRAKPWADPLLLGERFSVLFREVWLHRKMLRDWKAGLQHLVIFWGFIVVTFGTVDQILEGIASPIRLRHLLGVLYRPVVLLEEFFYGAVLVAVLYGLSRRFVAVPPRLKVSKKSRLDAIAVLLVIGVLMVSGLLMSARAVNLGEDPAALRPIGALFATLPLISFFQELGWWVHLVAVVGFLVYLPYSKHFHVIVAAPNLFFSRRTPRGRLSPLVMDDPTVDRFGIVTPREFTWKDLLDGYACTECGRCNEYCPTASTGKALKPRDLIIKLRAHTEGRVSPLFANSSALTGASLEDPMSSSHSVVGPVFSEEEIWDCTSCRACVEACPVGIDHVEKIVGLRRGLVLMEGKNPDEATELFRKLETSSNPWGMDSHSRGEWMFEEGVPRFDPDRHEYLYFVGCAGSFDERNKKVARAIIKILRAANVTFGILGPGERCTGDSARRLGNEYLGQMMARECAAGLTEARATKVVTACPHCFNALKVEYPDFGFRAEVFHHSELIARLIQAQKLTVEAGIAESITYHDSCYLGRYHDITEPQRAILSATSRLPIIELSRNRQQGFCCGAGGGRMWLEEKTGERINLNRVDEVLESGAETVATACPFCMTMMEDGLKKRNSTEIHRVTDIAELVAENLTTPAS